jgi:hypothetical protein
MIAKTELQYLAVAIQCRKTKKTNITSTYAVKSDDGRKTKT